MSSVKVAEQLCGNTNDRNGCGKSTVLQALADRLIPGIPPSLRIHIVSQVNSEPGAEGEHGEKKGTSGAQTALQRVLDGHVERTKALRERAGMFCYSELWSSW